MAMATACRLLFTMGAFFAPLGLRPECSVPALYSPITLATLACFADFFMAYFIDLLPLHFHFRRDRLLGEFGSDFQSPLILADRAQ
jgi:hypothetical protein